MALAFLVWMSTLLFFSFLTAYVYFKDDIISIALKRLILFLCSIVAVFVSLLSEMRVIGKTPPVWFTLWTIGSYFALFFVLRYAIRSFMSRKLQSKPRVS